MLHSLHIVPKILKWGFVAIASVLAIRLLWWLLWRVLEYIRAMFSLFWYGLRKPRGKRGIYYLLMCREIYLNLKCFEGTIEDIVMFGRLTFSFLVPDALVSLMMPEVALHGLFEKIFKATARSKRAKRLIQDERAFFRQIVVKAVQMQDQRAKEIVDEIRSIVGTDIQVQELLAGII